MEPRLIERVAALRRKEKAHWDDEFYSLDALTNLDYRALLMQVARQKFGDEDLPTVPRVRQSKKLPAWAHPLNDEPPKPANYKTFVEKGLTFVDPVDGAAYTANGQGHFLSANMTTKVREHTGHTLLPVTSDTELTYVKLRNFFDYIVEPLAAELKDQQLDFVWVLDEFTKAGGKFDRHEKVTSREYIVVSALYGYTEEVALALEAAAARYKETALLKKAQLKEQRKEEREWMKTLPEREKEEAMAKEQDDANQAKWSELYQKAEAAGLAEDFSDLWLSLPHSDTKNPVLTAELLVQFEELIMAKAAKRSELVVNTDAGLEVITQRDATIHVVAGNVAVDVQAGTLTTTAVPDEPAQEEKAEEAEKPSEPEPQVFYDEEGIGFNEDGEIVSMPEEVRKRLMGDAPVDANDEPFEINSKERANWFTRKIRGWQKEIEAVKEEISERANSQKAIESRISQRIKGLRWVLGQSFLTWFKEAAAKEKKQSVHLVDGTVKAKATGGLTCVDEGAFKLWMKEMEQEESAALRALYGIKDKTTFSISETQIMQNYNDGITYGDDENAPTLPPGYVILEEDNFGDFEITAPPKPRGSKKDKEAPAA